LVLICEDEVVFDERERRDLQVTEYWRLHAAGNFAMAADS